MILTVTPNPMLDKTLWLDRLEPGTTHRAQRMAVLVGGKGINVSRALQGWGEATLATGFLGGHTGREIRRLLDGEGIAHDFVEIRHTTREGFTCVTATGQRTAVFEPGHLLQEEELEALQQKLATLLPRCRALALCGSMPCPGHDGMYADLIRRAHAAGVPVFLDSYEGPLRQGLAAAPDFLKPNREEALSTFDLDLRKTAERERLLRLLLAHGARAILLTDGGRPVTAVINGSGYEALPPPAIRANPLGSGDTMVAAFLHGWLRQLEAEELLRFAVAAGTVNAMHELPGHAPRDEIHALAPQVKLMPWPAPEQPPEAGSETR